MEKLANTESYMCLNFCLSEAQARNNTHTYLIFKENLKALKYLNGCLEEGPMLKFENFTEVRKLLML